LSIDLTKATLIGVKKAGGRTREISDDTPLRQIRRRLAGLLTRPAGRHVWASAALALVMTACMPGGRTNEVATGYQPASTQAGAKAGAVGLQPCVYRSMADGRDFAADCGQLVVPEHRGAAGSRLIALPLIRVHAQDPSPEEPIFTFQGGPGAPNLVDFPIAALVRRHDIVMVGYRGVDGGAKLDCPEVADHIAAAQGALTGAAALASYAEGARLCAARLTRQGVDLAAYSMPETVDDQEAARRALGYGRVDLLGGSYGTRLELIYMWRYPESLRRVVMIGANPPGHFVWNPALTDAKLARYAALCLADAGCRARTGDPMADFRRVSAHMPASWLGAPIDPDRVRFVTFFMLHESIDPRTAPLPLDGPAAVDAWLAAAHGDASGLALLSGLSHAVLPHLIGTWGEFLAMGSGEYSDLTPDQARSPSGAVVGAPSLFFWGLAHGWPAKPDDTAYRTTGSSDVETLVIGGTLDATTPVEGVARDLMPKLSHGRLVTLAELGHVQSFWGSQPVARDHLLTTFFDRGDVNSSLYVRQAPVFRVENGLPHVAHMLRAAAALASLIVAAAIGLVVRALGRRRRAAA
jgi:pimeloyl-ACP methyl ester carboxylesterase